jgi:hypothetical protein
MQWPEMLEGPSLTRLVQGALVGSLATVLIGFNWGGWTLESTARQIATQKATAALVTILGPMCADKFRRETEVTANMTELKKVSTWMQDTYIQRGGWATFPGMAAPDLAVAQECAKLLTAAQ